MNSNLLKRILGALAVTGAAASVSGQTTGDQTTQAAPAASLESPVQLPNFSVTANTTDAYRATNTTAGSRTSGNIMDIAGSITVLSPQFIADISPTRLFDATKYAAGISEGQGDGFYDRQYIRGFQNNRPTVDNFASIQSENADSLFVDHIEIVKGPSAILAPTGTPGGQINVIDKTPQYKETGSISADLGMIDAQRVTVDMTGPLPDNRFAYRFLAGYQNGELNTGGTKDQRKLLGAELSFKPNDRTTLMLRGTAEDRWVFVYFPAYFDPTLSVNGADGVLAPGFKDSGSRNGTESWAHRGGMYYTADFLLTSSFGDHVSLRVAAKAQDNEMRDAYMYGVIPYDLSNRYNPYTGQETPNYTWALDPVSGRYLSTYSAYYDPTAIIRQPSKTDESTKDFNLQADLAIKYNFGGISSALVGGAVFDHQTDGGVGYSAATLPAINLYAPVYGAAPDFGAVNYRFNSNATSNEEYINEQLGFWNDRILAVVGAVRNGSYGSNAGTDSPTVSKTVGEYGLVVHPVEHVTVYGSRSENSVPGYPNGTLLWQDGQQWEYGAKASFFDDRLSVTAAHFQISQTNVSVANPRFQSDPNNQPRNLISDIKEHGEEIEVAGGITQNLSIMGSVTWLHQRDSLNRPVIMVPDHMAGAVLNYRFTDPTFKGLSLFVGTNYVSRRSGEIPQIDFTALGVVTQPSFFLPSLQLWSAGGKYDWSKSFTTAINVDNLFDKKYVGLSSGRFLGGVGTPLNVRVTLTYRF
jgi:iron complex outermembrane receptor protein